MARAVVKFDADTSAINAKLQRVRRNAAGIGQAFTRGAGGFDKLAGQIGGIASSPAASLTARKRPAVGPRD